MSGEELLSAVFVAILVAFYLMFLRPIQKDQEKHRQQIRDLRPGDQVLTTAGFIGRVKDIQVQESGPSRISLELADGVIFTAVSSAIAQRLISPEVSLRTTVTAASSAEKDSNS